MSEHTEETITKLRGLQMRARDVACPECGAAAGELCVTHYGTRSGLAHHGRIAGVGCRCHRCRARPDRVP